MVYGWLGFSSVYGGLGIRVCEAWDLVTCAFGFTGWRHLVIGCAVVNYYSIKEFLSSNQLDTLVDYSSP